jgi:hypothetical protein
MITMKAAHSITALNQNIMLRSIQLKNYKHRIKGYMFWHQFMTSSDLGKYAFKCMMYRMQK